MGKRERSIFDTVDILSELFAYSENPSVYFACEKLTVNECLDKFPVQLGVLDYIDDNIALCIGKRRRRRGASTIFDCFTQACEVISTFIRCVKNVLRRINDKQLKFRSPTNPCRVVSLIRHVLSLLCYKNEHFFQTTFGFSLDTLRRHYAESFVQSYMILCGDGFCTELFLYHILISKGLIISLATSLLLDKQNASLWVGYERLAIAESFLRLPGEKKKKEIQAYYSSEISHSSSVVVDAASQANVLGFGLCKYADGRYVRNSNTGTENKLILINTTVYWKKGFFCLITYTNEFHTKTIYVCNVHTRSFFEITKPVSTTQAEVISLLPPEKYQLLDMKHDNINSLLHETFWVDYFVCSNITDSNGEHQILSKSFFGVISPSFCLRDLEVFPAQHGYFRISHVQIYSAYQNEDTTASVQPTSRFMFVTRPEESLTCISAVGINTSNDGNEFFFVAGTDAGEMICSPPERLLADSCETTTCSYNRCPQALTQKEALLQKMTKKLNNCENDCLYSRHFRQNFTSFFGDEEPHLSSPVRMVRVSADVSFAENYNLEKIPSNLFGDTFYNDFIKSSKKGKNLFYSLWIFASKPNAGVSVSRLTLRLMYYSQDDIANVVKAFCPSCAQRHSFDYAISWDPILVIRGKHAGIHLDLGAYILGVNGGSGRGLFFASYFCAKKENHEPLHLSCLKKKQNNFIEAKILTIDWHGQEVIDVGTSSKSSVIAWGSSRFVVATGNILRTFKVAKGCHQPLALVSDFGTCVSHRSKIVSIRYSGGPNFVVLDEANMLTIWSLHFLKEIRTISLCARELDVTTGLSARGLFEVRQLLPLELQAELTKNLAEKVLEEATGLDLKVQFAKCEPFKKKHVNFVRNKLAPMTSSRSITKPSRDIHALSPPSRTSVMDVDKQKSDKPSLGFCLNTRHTAPPAKASQLEAEAKLIRLKRKNRRIVKEICNEQFLEQEAARSQDSISSFDDKDVQENEEEKEKKNSKKPNLIEEKIFFEEKGQKSNEQNENIYPSLPTLKTTDSSEMITNRSAWKIDSGRGLFSHISEKGKKNNQIDCRNDDWLECLRTACPRNLSLEEFYLDQVELLARATTPIIHEKTEVSTFSPERRVENKPANNVMSGLIGNFKNAPRWNFGNYNDDCFASLVLDFIVGFDYIAVLYANKNLTEFIWQIWTF